jgi:Mce-associated membrane protein
MEMAATRTVREPAAVKDRPTLDALDPTLRPRGPGLTPQVRLVIAVVLAVALVVAVVWGVWLTVDQARGDAAAPGSDGASMAAEQQDRRDVQLAVASFAANFNNYSFDDLDGYQERLTPLLTSGFSKSFALTVDGIITLATSSEVTSKGTVVQTAVSNIDSDNATALVVADAHISSAFGERERHFRWKVDVVQVDGDWLIDNFEPVA